MIDEENYIEVTVEANGKVGVIFTAESQDEDGYLYDVYDAKDEDRDNSLDGGMCTGNLENAFRMLLEIMD